MAFELRFSSSSSGSGSSSSGSGSGGSSSSSSCKSLKSGECDFYYEKRLKYIIYL